MIRRYLLLVLLSVLLTACQSGGEVVPTPIGEVTRPDLVGLINWERSPTTVVFRAEVVGGADAFYLRNEVPYCTVYGDNRVVWTISNGVVDNAVAFDFVSDETIRLFVEDLTINERIYTLPSGVQNLPTDVEPPTYELLTLFVNGEAYQFDSLGGWPLGKFQAILDKCRSLSQSPIRFEPSAGWLSAQRVEYDPNVPSVRWSNTLSGLDLGAIADKNGERQWVTGDILRVIWEVLRRDGFDVQFEDERGGVYHVALEVPGVNKTAPPPP